MGRQTRQRPISCQFCRVRKLRCSRQFPCSNCTSRGVQCRQPPQDPPPASRLPAPARKRASVPASSNDPDILSRLERLETLLALRLKGDDAEEVSGPSPEVPPSTGSASTTTRTDTTQSEQPLPPKVKGLTADALFLERSCLGPKLQDSALSDNLVFRTCPIRLITQSSSYVFQDISVPSAALSIEPTKCIWLPNRDEATQLVNKYITEITYIHHVIHGPTLRLLVDDVYDSLQQDLEAVIGSIYLLLCICANVTFSWIDSDAERKLFNTTAEANAQTTFWIKAAMDVFDHSQRTCHASLECIQGLLIWSFLICNLEGISSRARSGVYKATIMSRELGLHRLDYDHNVSSGQKPRYTGLRAELGRRLWWYIVSTDWMLARFSGPHEGTYMINPDQMVTRLPLNMNDEDLKDGEEPVGKPMHEPTVLSYFLQRIRLAQLCRAFTDRVPLAASNPDAVGYNVVLDLDAEIDKFIQQLPPFFYMDPNDLKLLPPSDFRRSTSFLIQRYIINLFVHGQRCKLHIPYFARGSIEPEYVCSRETALKSARLIIQTEHKLERENAAFATTRLRLTVVLHSVFLATIVLLLNVCLDTNGADRVAKQQEMLNAWKIMEMAKAQSIPAARLLDLLKEVLTKHNVPIPAVDGGTRPLNRNQFQESGRPLTPAPEEVSNDTGPFESAYVGAEWVPDSRMDLDGIDWDSIFWGLDAPFI